MQEMYSVRAYWGARKETALECARRAELFFHMLARCDPSFAQWYRAGRRIPRELPGHPVHPDVKEWEKLFLRGRIRTDYGDVIEDLGFSEIVWNAKKEHTRLEFHCGEYVYSPGEAGNNCLLYPPTTGAVRERLLHAPVLAEVLTCMATAWNPDFAVATSNEMRDLVNRQGREVEVGWLTYLSRRLGTLPPLPAPVLIQPVDSLGWLLILSPERMTASNPEHVALTSHVRELLQRAGLLARPQSEPIGE